jgi:AcrR family transcriptional regulator
MAMAKRRVLTPDSVVQTAAELANEACGIEAVTLNRLAEALDIKVPSLYNHVNGLAGLRRDLTLLAVQDLLRQLRQAVRGVAGREALLNVAHAYRAFAQANPGLYPLVLAAPPPGDQALLEVSEDLVSMLQLLMASYGLQGAEAIHAIRGLRSVVHGFVSLEQAGGFGMAISLDDSFQRLIEIFLDGIAGRP